MNIQKIIAENLENTLGALRDMKPMNHEELKLNVKPTQDPKISSLYYGTELLLNGPTDKLNRLLSIVNKK